MDAAGGGGGGRPARSFLGAGGAEARAQGAPRGLGCPWGAGGRAGDAGRPWTPLRSRSRRWSTPWRTSPSSPVSAADRVGGRGRAGQLPPWLTRSISDLSTGDLRAAVQPAPSFGSCLRRSGPALPVLSELLVRDRAGLPRGSALVRAELRTDPQSGGQASGSPQIAGALPLVTD